MQRSIHLAARLCFAILALFTAGAVARGQTPDFSGVWKQDNDRCQPKRHGDVTLRIGQHDADLTIETSILRGSQVSRHALQKYTTDGRVSVSTGADGDEFHTAIVRRDGSLVFSIEEHEEGRVILSKEIWKLTDNGAAIERVREPADGDKQTLIYVRQP